MASRKQNTTNRLICPDMRRQTEYFPNPPYFFFTSIWEKNRRKTFRKAGALLNKTLKAMRRTLLANNIALMLSQLVIAQGKGGLSRGEPCSTMINQTLDEVFTQTRDTIPHIKRLHLNWVGFGSEVVGPGPDLYYGDPGNLLNLFSTLLASQVLWSYSRIKVGRPLMGRPAVRCRRILGQDTERQTAPDGRRLSVSDCACEWLAFV